jgi:hypothetical protein
MPVPDAELNWYIVHYRLLHPHLVFDKVLICIPIINRISKKVKFLPIESCSYVGELKAVNVLPPELSVFL